MNITTPHLITILRKGSIGILYAELCYLTITIGLRVYKPIVQGNSENTVLLYCLIGLLVVVAFLLIAVLWSFAKRALGSRRFDVFLAFCFGILISISFSGIGYGLYTGITSRFSIFQLLVLVSIPFVAYILVWFRAKQLQVQKSTYKKLIFL